MSKCEPVAAHSTTSQALVDDLVQAAQRRGGFAFVQALLRVGGIEGADFFEMFRTDFGDLGSDGRGLGTAYARWLRHHDFLAFIWNLLQCEDEKPFHAHPLAGLSEGLSFSDHSHVTAGKVAVVAAKARAAGRADLADYIEAAYPEPAIDACHAGSPPDDEASPCARLRDLGVAIVAASDRERREFGSTNRFFRWPRYEVLEMLANEDTGLYGYRVHFSNGCHSEFSRPREGITQSLNMHFEPDGQVNYFCGMIDELRREWRVGSKPLHEIGLPGQYNRLGEWRPLVYEGPTDAMLAEIDAATSDPAERGVMFYIRTTGYWVVEFAVRANVDLPMEHHLQFGPDEYPLRLWKLPENDQTSINERLYDGWVTLPAPTPEAIRNALAVIRVGMSRLAFVYDATLRWCLKYTTMKEFGGLATPSKDDLRRFDDVLVNAVHPALDTAMSWCNAGRNAEDSLTAYLCYFNALEGVVDAVHEDELNLPGPAIPAESKGARRQARRECVQRLHDELFTSEPEEFVRRAYFECVKPLTKRRRQVAEAVWGTEHWAVRALFEPRGGDQSLQDIRDMIAHGSASVLSPEDVAVVRRGLSDLREIAKGLILRIALGIKPGDAVERWSGKHRLGMSTTDPRSTLVVSTLTVFPASDWRIRPEWIG